MGTRNVTKRVTCNNFVVEATRIKSNATGQVFKIRRDFTCETKDVVYVSMCKKCNFQGVGSTTKWKPRLGNYKSHVRKRIHSCGVATHFIDCCFDRENPTRYMSFVIVDCLNNSQNMSFEEREEALLQKEKFWIGTLVTQHKGMNCSHDWNRKKRSEKLKLS